MIPKTIHYCWLSNDPIPTDLQECIKSWKRHMPNWNIKLWNTISFDVHSSPFVEQAYNARKWAFAADYIRVYALYTEGGIYLDSDVFVRKNMDFVLNNRAFSAVEYFPQHAEPVYQSGRVDSEGNKRTPSDKIHGIQIQAAILGSEKGHPFFKDCLDFYNAATFKMGADGIPEECDISPIVFAGIAEKYGFKYLDIEQQLDEGFKLYPSNIFSPQPWLMKKESVAVHCCKASWRQTQKPIERAIYNTKVYVKRVLKRIGLWRETGIDAMKL